MSLLPADHPSFLNALSKAKSQVQDYLDKSDEFISAIANAAPEGVSDRMSNLLSRKGKKIRSTILALIATSGEKAPDIERVSRSCAAIELLHLASLVHDDIIDETSVRRGQRTAHIKWGNKIAVLIGDYILSQAMSCVLNEKNAAIPMALATAANDLIAGEINELDCTGNMELPLERYSAIIRGKTASLVEASAKMGAHLAGFDEDRVEKCGQLGMHFGIAFQIVDDLLDYGIGAKDLDKAKFTDISNGLVTLPLIYYFQSASPSEKDSLIGLLKKAAEPNVAEEIRLRLQNAKVFDRAKETALQHISEALAIAEDLPAKEHIVSLHEFIFSMTERGN